MNGSELTAAKEMRSRWRRIFATGIACWQLLLAADGAAAKSPLTNSISSPLRMTLLEAARETLAHDPNIQLQELQIKVDEGLLQNAAGQFDPALSTALAQGVTRVPRSATDIAGGGFSDALTAVQDLTIYRAGITNQFRSGISVGSGIELDRFVDNLYQTQPANRASVSFVLKVPLLKGLGRAAADAQEQAARVNREAAVLDLQQTIAARILNTVAAYWNCLAAAEQLKVLRKSMERAASLVKAVQALAGIREMAASELLQAQADEAQKTAAVSAGEQALWQARQDLAQAIGLALEKMTQPPEPMEEWPSNLQTNLMALQLDEPRLLIRSLHRRADYQSSQKAEAAARILEVGARLNAKPQLDLNLEAGYPGLDEANGLKGYFASLNPRPVSGPNLLASLSLEWPFGNHAARGLLVQRTAEQQQSQLRSQALARSIQAGILVALKELQNSRAALEKSEVASKDYGEAVDQEREKLRLRLSSILDAITLADRMESAQLSEVAARARYWIAVARCRYETGWLVRPGITPDSPISLEDFVTLPPWDRDDAAKPWQ